jgi:phosphatidylinositol alpha-1,6-mannosyltransferase
VNYPYINTVYRETNCEIEAFNPDVVHAMHINDWGALLAANEAGIPNVLSAHALELGNETLAEQAIKDTEIVHAITECTESLVRGIVPNADTTIIPPSIRVDQYREVRDDIEYPDNGPVVCLARFVDRKNIETVIRAWGHMDAPVRESRELIIAGDGPNRESLKQLAADESDIRFTGWIDEEQKRRLLASADAFVFVPRRSGYDVEGFGIVYIEAQAAETPVIGSSHGGAPEAIGEAGLIVENENDPIEVADAMERILTNFILRSELLAAVDNRIETFDIANVTHRHVASYRDQLEAR